MSVPVTSRNTAHNVSALPEKISPKPSVVFTDVDDTLTFEGRLPAETFTALYQLQSAGFEVVPVTGASAGWCDCLMKTWPINHIIGENGALRMEKSATGVVSTHFVKNAQKVESDLENLLRLGDRLSQKYPEVQFTQDQKFRITDIAFDIGQTVTVHDAVAEQATQWLLDNGVQAKRSSIHINAWIGEYTKASGALNWLEQRNINEKDCLFIGDSPNDESMFQQFSLSVGVANIKRFLPTMKYRPMYIANNKGGFGFVDLAEALLRT